MADKIDRQMTHRGAARSVTGLAAMLAHEIKNPLSGIRGAAQLLESGLSDEDRALTRLITDETDRIVSLVDRMEVFSDERPIDRYPVNIHVVLDHVKAIAKNGFASRIKIFEDYDPSLPPVYANRDQLVQVFLNLVKNAAEAIGADPNGEITLSTAFRPGIRVAVPGSQDRVSLPLEFMRARQRRRRLGGYLADPVRSLHHHQAERLGPWPGAGRQDRRRAWRHHRMRFHAARHHLPHPDAGMEGQLADSHDAETRSTAMNVRGSILVADDDAAIRTVLNQALIARRSRCARHLQRRDAVALGGGGRGRSRHHRRRDARRERLRHAAAHQEGAAGTAGHRHERAEHLHDGDPRLRDRRLRISAEAVRPHRAPQHRQPRAVGAEAAADRAARRTSSRKRCRWSAARRPCRTSTACSPA